LLLKVYLLPTVGHPELLLLCCVKTCLSLKVFLGLTKHWQHYHRS